jgi:hypothetical protein
MALAAEIVFALALAVVVVSFAGVARDRLSERVLLALAGALTLAAGLAAVALGVNFVERFAKTEVLLLATGGIAAAAAAEAGLIGLARGLRRVRDLERLDDEAAAKLVARYEAHNRERQTELERLLARERAHATHALGEQERTLAEERRDVVARQAEHARVELTHAVASVQERLERRLTAWAADLDRGQRELEAQLTELSQRHQEALAAHDARLEADAERLETASDEQRTAIEKLRAEVQRLGTGFLEEGRAEIELHASERRRALADVAERLRSRERGLREQLDREETEARTRLAAGLVEAERRHLANLERTLERAANRLAEDAERRFDAEIKESRERSAERLARELEKSIEQFARQAENDVAERINDIARAIVDRLQRRINDVVRAGEAEHSVAADRVRALSERLDEALAAAEERVAALELDLERSARALGPE